MFSTIIKLSLFILISVISFYSFVFYFDHDVEKYSLSPYNLLIPKDVLVLPDDKLKKKLINGEKIKKKLDALKVESAMGDWSVIPILQNNQYYCVISSGDDKNVFTMLHELAHCDLSKEMIKAPDALLNSLEIIDYKKKYANNPLFIKFISIYVNEVYADIVASVNYYLIYNKVDEIENVINYRIENLCKKNDLLHYSSPYLVDLMYSIKNNNIINKRDNLHIAQKIMSNKVDVDFIYESYIAISNKHKINLCHN